MSKTHKGQTFGAGIGHDVDVSIVPLWVSPA
jgi:hypothetical protein